MRIAPQAAQWEKDVAKRSQELAALIQPLLTSQDPAVKKQVGAASVEVHGLVWPAGNLGHVFVG